MVKHEVGYNRSTHGDKLASALYCEKQKKCWIKNVAECLGRTNSNQTMEILLKKIIHP